MWATERNDSEKVPDGDGLDGSATRRDCTYNAENPRKLQSPSRAAELIPQSRNIGKVSSIMDRARP